MRRVVCLATVLALVLALPAGAVPDDDAVRPRSALKVLGLAALSVGVIVLSLGLARGGERTLILTGSVLTVGGLALASGSGPKRAHGVGVAPIDAALDSTRAAPAP